MADQFVWWHGNDYTVLGGSRKGLDRRMRSERRGCIASGIFAVNVLERRHNEERRQIQERRMGDMASSADRLADLTRSIPFGIFLLTISMIILLSGITIFPSISLALGLLLVTAGAFFIFILFRKRFL
jgi:hypothetical protein